MYKQKCQARSNWGGDKEGRRRSNKKVIFTSHSPKTKSSMIRRKAECVRKLVNEGRGGAHLHVTGMQYLGSFLRGRVLLADAPRWFCASTKEIMADKTSTFLLRILKEVI